MTGNPYSWWHLTGERRTPPRAVQHDLDVDVAIIGAGYTGLWTAYYLKKLSPSLRVCVLEKDFAGIGASGRNGGWCCGDMAGSDAVHDKKQAGGALRMAAAIHETVDEVGRAIAELDIDFHWKKGGIIRPATNAGQLKRLSKMVQQQHEIGLL